MRTTRPPPPRVARLGEELHSQSATAAFSMARQRGESGSSSGCDERDETAALRVSPPVVAVGAPRPAFPTYHLQRHRMSPSPPPPPDGRGSGSPPPRPRALLAAYLSRLTACLSDAVCPSCCQAGWRLACSLHCRHRRRSCHHPHFYVRAHATRRRLLAALAAFVTVDAGAVTTPLRAPSTSTRRRRGAATRGATWEAVKVASR